MRGRRRGLTSPDSTRGTNSSRPAKLIRKWASWRGCSRSALCRAPTPATGSSLCGVTAHISWCSRPGGFRNCLMANLPRLLLAWVCTEAVRTQSRELVLGRLLAEFMRQLGMQADSGGSRGERTRLKNQMRRLFSCSMSLIYLTEERELRVNSFVADRGLTGPFCTS